jgi:hypothetical protein
MNPDEECDDRQDGTRKRCTRNTAGEKVVSYDHDEPVRSLSQCIRENDIDAVKRMVKEGARVMERRPDGMSPFTDALSDDHVRWDFAIAKWFILVSGKNDVDNEFDYHMNYNPFHLHLKSHLMLFVRLIDIGGAHVSSTHGKKLWAHFRFVKPEHVKSLLRTMMPRFRMPTNLKELLRVTYSDSDFKYVRHGEQLWRNLTRYIDERNEAFMNALGGLPPTVLKNMTQDMLGDLSTDEMWATGLFG